MFLSTNAMHCESDLAFFAHRAKALVTYGTIPNPRKKNEVRQGRRRESLMSDNVNIKEPSTFLYGPYIRKVFSAGLQLTRQHRWMLQDIRLALRRGSAERVVVVREIQRYLRLERATAALAHTTGSDILNRVAELNLAVLALQSSPDAGLVRDLLQQFFAASV